MNCVAIIVAGGVGKRFNSELPKQFIELNGIPIIIRTISIFEQNENINSISIFNSLGIEVKRIEQTELIGKSKITISTAVLPNGFYHCSFVYQTGRVTKSFVVLR